MNVIYEIRLGQELFMASALLEKRKSDDINSKKYACLTET